MGGDRVEVRIRNAWFPGRVVGILLDGRYHMKLNLEPDKGGKEECDLKVPASMDRVRLPRGLQKLPLRRHGHGRRTTDPVPPSSSQSSSLNEPRDWVQRSPPR